MFSSPSSYDEPGSRVDLARDGRGASLGYGTFPVIHSVGPRVREVGEGIFGDPPSWTFTHATREKLE